MRKLMSPELKEEKWALRRQAIWQAGMKIITKEANRQGRIAFAHMKPMGTPKKYGFVEYTSQDGQKWLMNKDICILDAKCKLVSAYERK